MNALLSRPISKEFLDKAAGLIVSHLEDVKENESTTSIASRASQSALSGFAAAGRLAATLEKDGDSARAKMAYQAAALLEKAEEILSSDAFTGGTAATVHPDQKGAA